MTTAQSSMQWHSRTPNGILCDIYQNGAKHGPATNIFIVNCIKQIMDYIR